jgi:hypothetical protein
MLTTLLEAITPVPTHGTAAAQEHLDNLTKPPGSLGRLEELALRLALVRGGAPSVAMPVIFTFAADHGVAAEGVSAYPQTVTAQMVENFLRGGAAVNVLTRQSGARVVVADFGVVTPVVAAPALAVRRIGPGTNNIAVGPAMSRAQALEAIEAGARLAQEAIAAGADIVPGENIAQHPLVLVGRPLVRCRMALEVGLREGAERQLAALPRTFGGRVPAIRHRRGHRQRFGAGSRERERGMVSKRDPPHASPDPSLPDPRRGPCGSRVRARRRRRRPFLSPRRLDPQTRPRSAAAARTLPLLPLTPVHDHLRGREYYQ